MSRLDRISDADPEVMEVTVFPGKPNFAFGNGFVCPHKGRTLHTQGPLLHCKPPRSWPWRRLHDGDRYYCTCGQWWEYGWQYTYIEPSHCPVPRPTRAPFGPDISVWFRIEFVLAGRP